MLFSQCVSNVLFMFPCVLAVYWCSAQYYSEFERTEDRDLNTASKCLFFSSQVRVVTIYFTCILQYTSCGSNRIHSLQGWNPFLLFWKTTASSRRCDCVWHCGLLRGNKFLWHCFFSVIITVFSFIPHAACSYTLLNTSASHWLAWCRRLNSSVITLQRFVDEAQFKVT